MCRNYEKKMFRWRHLFFGGRLPPPLSTTLPQSHPFHSPPPPPGNNWITFVQKMILYDTLNEFTDFIVCSCSVQYQLPVIAFHFPLYSYKLHKLIAVSAVRNEAHIKLHANDISLNIKSNGPKICISNILCVLLEAAVPTPARKLKALFRAK